MVALWYCDELTDFNPIQVFDTICTLVSNVHFVAITSMALVVGASRMTGMQTSAPS
jgi:hypothetical protein